MSVSRDGTAEPGTAPGGEPGSGSGDVPVREGRRDGPGAPETDVADAGDGGDEAEGAIAGAVSADDPEAMDRAIEAFGRTDLEAQRRRIEHGRSAEDYLEDPEIAAAIRREMAEAGTLDPLSADLKVRDDATPDEESFTLVQWKRRWERLPVTPGEALRAARERGEASEAAGSKAGEGLAEPEPETGESREVRDDGDQTPDVPERDADGNGGAVGEPPLTESDARGIDDRPAGRGESRPSGQRPEKEVRPEADDGGATAEALRTAIADVVGEDIRNGLRELADANSALQEALVAVLRDGMGRLEGRIPTLEEGRIGALVTAIDGFGETVDAYVADFHRSREIERRARGRRGWLAFAAAVPLLVAAGVLGQKQFEVVPDGTNGWKSIVWESHGMDVAKCMRSAQDAGRPLNCPLRVRPR